MNATKVPVRFRSEHESPNARLWILAKKSAVNLTCLFNCLNLHGEIARADKSHIILFLQIKDRFELGSIAVKGKRGV